MKRTLLSLICLSFIQIVHAQDCQVSISASDNVLTCDNTVTLTVPNLDGFDYQWFKGSRRLFGETDTIYTVTEPGLYQVTLNNFNDPDAVPCVSSAQITITQSLSDIPISLGNDTSICSNETVLLAPDRTGDSYLWSTGETTREITFSPSHEIGVNAVWVIVTDNNCQGVDTVNVNARTAPTITFPSDTSVCNVGNLTLDATHTSATYLWSDGSANPTLDVSTDGQYWVTVMSNGCSDADTVDVSFVDPPAVDLGPDLSICVGESVDFDAGNPRFTPTWSTGESSQGITFDATVAGDFEIWVKLENGTCDDADTISIHVKDAPEVTLGSDLIGCTGDTFTLDAENIGASYLWSDGSTNATLTTSESGQYWVEVDNGTCTDADTVEVTIVTPPDANLGDDQIICVGETITLDAVSLGSTITWSNGDATETIDFSSETAGTFSFWLKLDNGTCEDIDTVEITVRDLPTVNLGDDIIGCEGEEFTLEATGSGTNFLWSDNSITSTLSVDTTGQYWVKVNDGFCDNYDTVDVTIFPQPQVSLGNDISLCEDKTFDLDGGNTSSSFNYAWSTGAISQTITVDNTITSPIILEVSNDHCADTDTIEFTFFSLPQVNLGDDIEACKDDQITFDAGAFESYAWSTGATSQSISFKAEVTGDFSVTVTDANGCENSDEVKLIKVNVLPTIDLGDDLGVCQGTNITFDPGNNFVSYEWQDGSANQVFEAGQIGTYSVTVTDQNGCKAFDEARITQIYTLPQPGLVDAAIDCNTGDVVLNAGDFETYLWDDGSTDAERTFVDAGNYFVTVTDDNSCSNTDSVSITDPCDFRIIFPNAFVADNSAQTPIFQPSAVRVVDYQLLIYNRWGKLVFQSDDVELGWNGNIDGGTQPAPIGSYLYKAFYTGKRQGELVSEETQGSLLLIR